MLTNAYFKSNDSLNISKFVLVGTYIWIIYFWVILHTSHSDEIGESVSVFKGQLCLSWIFFNFHWELCFTILLLVPVCCKKIWSEGERHWSPRFQLVVGDTWGQSRFWPIVTHLPWLKHFPLLVERKIFCSEILPVAPFNKLIVFITRVHQGACLLESITLRTKMLPNPKDVSLAMSGQQHIGTGLDTDMYKIHSVWLVSENIKATRLFFASGTGRRVISRQSAWLVKHWKQRMAQRNPPWHLLLYAGCTTTPRSR